MSDLQYTDLTGCVVKVPMLDWLEDGSYYDEDQADDEDTFGILPCSRYCIGHEDGDGISVWLNDQMQEVEEGIA
ncbi:hypothetical protein J9253_06120 [Thiothrix litoralis]|uniref:Uncharacterized protein n=1 Tax=Thiothrix litoralis TaxID=2891210 RepID=A0ABX7WUZ5_9GAMM|nr:hypothetical protein [Thiothrix litoralis]QTR47509.1 hypothetical protein J9253_06120 [Thiothrix litoralis]